MLWKKILVTLMLLFIPGLIQAASSGRIEGTLKRAGQGLGGVTVLVDELGDHVVTDDSGSFRFTGVPAGEYSLTFTLGDASAVTSVSVTAGETTEVDQEVDWDVSFADAITVFSASRRQERIVEAPAAVTVVSREEAELAASPGQLPRMLEFTVGAEPTQSGLFDFNFNVRGFNTALTRRVQVLIDGRRTGSPFTHGQEWMMMGAHTEDVERIELVRGPGAALYGANAFNGVLSVVTRSPRTSQGGRLRLSTGELDTRKIDLRWASELGSGWYLKLLGGYYESDDWSRSRVDSVEYEGLPLERFRLPEDRKNRLDSGTVRLDKEIGGGVLSLEGGFANMQDSVLLIPLGRGYFPDVDRRWARFNYNSARWNVLGTHNSRVSDPQFGLGSGVPSFADSYNYGLEVQGNIDFAGGRGRLVGGVSYGEEETDTADPQGVQTIITQPVKTDERALFGQLDFEINDRLELVVALRADEGTLHDTEVSPKGSLVVALTPRQSLRLSYNVGFQVANGAEQFLATTVGALDLSPIEAMLAPLLGGVSLGLANVPVRALGNRDIEVEEIRGFEVGYSGILADKVFLSVDYYNNRMVNFITPLGPGFNPSIGPYRAPAFLPPPVAARIEMILASIPGLTNAADGAPLVALSFGNAGKVDSQGIELAVTYKFAASWLLDGSYTWFDFDVDEVGVAGGVPPNNPEHKFSLGLAYRGSKLHGALRYRFLDDFFWRSGSFAGTVPSYDVVNLDLSYELSERWQIGLNISNLLDDRHFEVFGGDVIERRALATAAFSW